MLTAKSFWFKKLPALVFVLALVPAWTGCGGLPEGAVAKVDDRVVARDKLDKAMERARLQYLQKFPAPGSPEYINYQKQQVQQLVMTEVMSLEAEKMGLAVGEEEIDSQVEKLKQQAGGEEQLNAIMAQYGVTMDEFRENIRGYVLGTKLFNTVTQDAPPASDEEALQYYNDNPDVFKKPETKRVRHILVADEAAANQVLLRLAAGEDFVNLAKEVSIDAGTRDMGGDLGERPAQGSGLVPEFEQAMAQLGKGQTSGPVKTQYGYHIIRVDRIIPPGQRSFESVKEKLKVQLMEMSNGRQNYYLDWLLKAMDRHDITYADEFKPDENAPLQAPPGQSGAGPQPQSQTTP